MANMVNVYFNSELLKGWCKAQGISLLWLSETCGRFRTYLNNCVIRGSISPEVLSKVSDLTGLSLDDLKNRELTGDEEIRKFLLDNGFYSQRQLEKETKAKENDEPIYNETFVTREEFVRPRNRETDGVHRWSREDPLITEDKGQKDVDLAKELLKWLGEKVAKAEFSVSVSEIIQRLEAVVKNGGRT